MPLYEYKCSRCKKTFEFLEKITSDPKTICPECGTQTLKRQISPAGFKLKGTGWYVTDFKNQKKPKDDVKKTSDKEKLTDKPATATTQYKSSSTTDSSKK
jgi:putative FmdB family regulatory protein